MRHPSTLDLSPPPPSTPHPPSHSPPLPLEPPCPPAPRLLAVGFLLPMSVLVLLNLVILVGNALVITAVFTHAKLRRSITNRFIVSLAVADMMVGAVVLPFSSANEVLRFWPFGRDWCSAWLAFDVWLCTASIFNLCAISFDRYLAISRSFQYPRLMSPTRAKLLIVCVWILSFVICFPPLIGWNDRRPGREPTDQSIVRDLEGEQGREMLDDFKAESGFVDVNDVDEERAWQAAASIFTTTNSDKYAANIAASERRHRHGHNLIGDSIDVNMAPEFHEKISNLFEPPNNFDHNSVRSQPTTNALQADYSGMNPSNEASDDFILDPSAVFEEETESGLSVQLPVNTTTGGAAGPCLEYAYECRLTSDPGYIIYSACGSFWVPMLVMVVFYWKIYKTASAATLAFRRGFIEKPGGGRSSTTGGLSNSSSENSLTLRVHRGGGGRGGSPTRASDGSLDGMGGAAGDSGSLGGSPRLSFDGRTMPRRGGTLTSSRRGRRGEEEGGVGGRLAVAHSACSVRRNLPRIVVTSTTACDVSVDLDALDSPSDLRRLRLQHDERIEARRCSLSVIQRNPRGCGDPLSRVEPLSLRGDPLSSGAETVTQSANNNVSQRNSRDSITSGNGSEHNGVLRTSRDSVSSGGSSVVGPGGNNILRTSAVSGLMREARSEAYLGTLGGSVEEVGTADESVSCASSRKSSLMSESGQQAGSRFSLSKTGFCLSSRLAHILPQLRSLNREKKAAKTVGVIVGCFIICWAPFFTVYLLRAFCDSCTPPLVFDVFFWLGYCNSAANPFIYGLCSRDFRYAFKKLLRCRCERKRSAGRRGGDGRLATMLRSLRLQIVTRRADGYL